jgi:DnaJ-class molecular chaperone
MCRFFGGGARQQESEEDKRGQDVEIELQVSLEDIYVGKIFTVRHMPRDPSISVCRGISRVVVAGFCFFFSMG